MIRIMADSTCDIGPELREQHNIGLIPLEVMLGDKTYEDGVNITVPEIFAWADENKTTPKTAAPSPSTVKRILRDALTEASELIVFSISSQMSASGNVIRLAAEQIGEADRIHTVDSQNLSTGIALSMLRAAEMAEAGCSAQEILREMDRVIPKVRASFVVDTLTYLHRGGRCSGVAAMAGSVLRLHPRINVVGGKMEPGQKYRGRLNKVILEYVSDMEESLRKAVPDHVFITHSGCAPEIVEEVRSYLKGLDHFREIHETRAGAVISSHCGPGTLGVLFREEN